MEVVSAVITTEVLVLSTITKFPLRNEFRKKNVLKNTGTIYFIYYIARYLDLLMCP